MKKRENIKYANLPIFNKGKIEKEEKINSRSSKFLTGFLIVFIIIVLLFCGYTMAKTVEQIIIKSKAEIAEPILLIENDQALDITATNNYGIYNFKIKNYNEKNKVTQADLQYYIEILSNTDDSVNIELFQDGNKINLNNSRTEYIHISKDKKEERLYKLKITYDKDKTKSTTDIMEKVQVRVCTEQSKG